VTAVGGTSGPESSNPEIACTSDVDDLIGITSGGGFSSYYDAPDFQKPFIETYFSTVDGTSKQPYSSNTDYNYDPSRRGYPDVALMANAYKIAVDGELERVDGTSASTPVFAGMLSLVNSQRVAAGKSTLGWVNPLLYKYYDSFTNDITEGDKNNCSALEVDYYYYFYSSYYYYHNCCDEGFYPTTGWDPITGLGSINVDEFIAVFKTLTFSPSPAPSPAPSSTPSPASSSVPSSTPSSPQASLSSKSLATGAIVGIVIACIAVLVGIVFLCHNRFPGPCPPAAAVSPMSTVELVEKNDVSPAPPAASPELL
jgi:subtilase family serine protease